MGEVEETSRISYEIMKEIAPKELPFFDDSNLDARSKEVQRL